MGRAAALGGDLVEEFEGLLAVGCGEGGDFGGCAGLFGDRE